ncbi:hypothetical protein AAT19DRAFT_16711 [Rhodotorula toruloides]|uniref:Uncharacterized protein n=1 Tax=Rhodotorula toruloides TaxID=5286 RepID=A0A2T0A441_RHOTO|nr:hypothetical protein AAT19DRAFT_16711 [Rhodotorula toruloides]
MAEEGAVTAFQEVGMLPSIEDIAGLPGFDTIRVLHMLSSDNPSPPPSASMTSASMASASMASHPSSVLILSSPISSESSTILSSAFPTSFSNASSISSRSFFALARPSTFFQALHRARSCLSCSVLGRPSRRMSMDGSNEREGGGTSQGGL